MTAKSQNINIETFKDDIKQVNVSGSFNANTVFYHSNVRNARLPFTYFLQGTVNLSWYLFSMPISYNYSNQGDNLNYNLPFKFNRLSLHPKYKWVQGHIGDVSMSFSPYTLNGHQFTGVGVELTPKIPLKLSLMGGRLLKAVETDTTAKITPAFERLGFGAMLKWEKPTYKLGLISFYANDDQASILPVFEEKKITPKENLVISLNSEVTIARNYSINVEYASTAITQDTRSEKVDSYGNILGFFIDNRISTEYYNALKTSFNVNILKANLGLNYERIDPNYETLGAYFFNNDFENITVNGNRSFFNNKVSLAFNIGYQRDNLKNQKNQSSFRNVNSFNLSYQINQSLSLSSSYSNFTTFTNNRLNQFDDINASPLEKELRIPEYRQLSQNANINLNWILTKGRENSQSINFNYSLASSANKENKIIRKGQANNFHNASSVYSLGFPSKKLTITTSLNYNYSDVGEDDSNSAGGSVGINKSMYENKLNLSFISTYNTSKNKTIKTDMLNFRLNASLVLNKKHRINSNIMQLFRNQTNTLNEFTATIGYSYLFNLNKKENKL